MTTTATGVQRLVRQLEFNKATRPITHEEFNTYLQQMQQAQQQPSQSRQLGSFGQPASPRFVREQRNVKGRKRFVTHDILTQPQMIQLPPAHSTRSGWAAIPASPVTPFLTQFIASFTFPHTDCRIVTYYTKSAKTTVAKWIFTTGLIPRVISPLSLGSPAVNSFQLQRTDANL